MTQQVMTAVFSDEYPDLLTWRKDHGFTQRQAARLLDMTQTYYARLERGKASAYGKRAKMLAKVTRVPLAVLVGAA